MSQKEVMTDLFVREKIEPRFTELGTIIFHYPLETYTNSIVIFAWRLVGVIDLLNLILFALQLLTNAFCFPNLQSIGFLIFLDPS